MKKGNLSYILKLVFIGFIMFGISAAVVMKLVFSIGSISMPDFTGMNFEKAVKNAGRMGVDLKLEDEVYSNVYEKGIVVSQNVKPKVKIKKGRSVYAVVSRGSKMIRVPDVTGMIKAKAVLNLKNLDLGTGYDDSISSSIHKEDTVIAQFPAAGADVPFNENVSTLRSEGLKDEVFMMPDVKKKNIFDVYKALRKHDLTVEKINVEVNNDLPSGSIISQSPEAGYAVNKKTPIILNASNKEDDLSLKKRLIKVTFTLESADPLPKHVKISVLSLAGTEAIYNKVTTVNEKIEVQPVVRGDALVQIFVGNELVKEHEFKAQ
ncbi:MAG TPA: PASTA domain-containing protein [Candidatus Goldiibacteriota bacterium]|mgnify:CR=1 FL=1|nr:PASTA domain-containing protein [Candidatus Goldiibacteriota bacterium]HPN64774.1 PASTA domain-containing protein [Candidatus Goldiibacteriota bacterium]HRQ44709.1 PASTA domain-containing protein [Candidatus Goldiibacteriota bacterium]